MTKTFADCEFRVQLLARVRTVLASEEDGLEVVDPATLVLQPGDLGEEFTQSFLARCREDTSAAEEAAPGQTADEHTRVCALLPNGLESAPPRASLSSRRLWPIRVP